MITTYLYVYIPGLIYKSKGPSHVDAIRLEASLKSTDSTKSGKSNNGNLHVYYKIENSHNKKNVIYHEGNVIYRLDLVKNDVINPNEDIPLAYPQYSILATDVNIPRCNYGRFYDIITDTTNNIYTHVLGYRGSSEECMANSKNNDPQNHDGIFILEGIKNTINVDIVLHFTYYTRITTSSSGDLIAGYLTDLNSTTPPVNNNSSELDLFNAGFIKIAEKEEYYNPAVTGVEESDFLYAMEVDPMLLYYDLNNLATLESFELPVNAGFLVSKTSTEGSTLTAHSVSFYKLAKYDLTTKTNTIPSGSSSDPYLGCNTTAYLDSLYNNAPDYFIGEYYRDIYTNYKEVTDVDSKLISIDSGNTYVNTSLVAARDQDGNTSGPLAITPLYEEANLNYGLQFNNITITTSIPYRYKYTTASLENLHYLYLNNPVVSIRNIANDSNINTSYTPDSNSKSIGLFSVFLNSYAVPFYYYCYLIRHKNANHYYQYVHATVKEYDSTYPEYKVFLHPYTLYWYDANNASRYKYSELGELKNIKNPWDVSNFYDWHNPCKVYGGGLDITSIRNKYHNKYEGNITVNGEPEANISFESTNWDDGLSRRTDYYYSTSGLTYVINEGLVTTNWGNKNEIPDLYLKHDSFLWKKAVLSSLGVMYGTEIKEYSSYNSSKVTKKNSLLEPGSEIQCTVNAEKNPYLEISMNIKATIPVMWCYNNDSYKTSDISFIKNLLSYWQSMNPVSFLSSLFVLNLDKSNIKYNNASDFIVYPYIINYTLGYDLKGTTLLVNVDTEVNYLSPSNDSILSVFPNIAKSKLYNITTFNTSFCLEERFIPLENGTTLNFNKSITLLKDTLYVFTVSEYYMNSSYKVTFNNGLNTLSIWSSRGLLLFYSPKLDRNITLEYILFYRSNNSYLGAVGLYQVILSNETMHDASIKAILTEISESKDLSISGSIQTSASNDNLYRLIVPEDGRSASLIIFPATYAIEEDTTIFEVNSSKTSDNYGYKYNLNFHGSTIPNISKKYRCRYLPEKACYRPYGFYRIDPSTSYLLDSNHIQLVNDSLSEAEVVKKLKSLKIRDAYVGG